MNSPDILGTGKINRLIISLGWPAALNFLVVTLYNLADVIFVGQWLGSIQIAAVVVVGTATFLFSSFGLAIGLGGASIIARALGEKNQLKARLVFANQNLLVVIFSLLLVLIGWVFEAYILRTFGANGEIFPYAQKYFRILLFGIPFLSYSMMGNNVIHTEGRAKVAMFNSLIPTVINIILNPLFIYVFNLGIEGAAWATLIGYIIGFSLVMKFFISQKGCIKFLPGIFNFSSKIILEIGEIGGSVLMNIFTSNIFVIILNQLLFKYEQESGVVIYGIISRVNMLFIIPIVGIEGGLRPIIGYNFGCQQMERIREAISYSIKYGMSICFFLLAIMFFSADYLIHFFTDDIDLIAKTPFAMKVIFSFFPLLMIQVITSAYYQAIGKAKFSFYLMICKNIVLLIPLLYILPYYFGFNGIFYTFPIVDILITVPTIWLLKNELNFKLAQRVLVN